MKKRNGSRSFHRLAASIAVACGLAAAGQAGAVHLNSRGSGQVLLYPYYTVNKAQQTYVTVLNTGTRAKMVSVSFREGYNSRQVMSFNLFLAPFDTWTGTVFALADVAGEGGDGAAILTSDRSCTAPDFWTEGHGTIAGSPYARFSSSSFTDDEGPQGSARTREGHIEIVALADLTGALADAVSFRSGQPADCARVRNLAAPTAETVAPTGGLTGSGAVINVGQGTYFSYRPDALGGFSSTVLLSGSNVAEPLSAVNDGGGTTVTARVAADGRLIEASYGVETNSERIDAVSAVLMAETLYNEYIVQTAIGANSDWVVTFPTKRFYTDPLLWAGETAAEPFVELFGENGSCVRAQMAHFNRESAVAPNGGFGAPFAEPRLCYGTNVLSFAGSPVTQSAALGSRLLVRDFSVRFDAGHAALNLNPTSEPHALFPSLGANAKVFHGLPAIGFWAVNLVNSNVADGVMSNYSAAVPHGSRVSCTAGEAACD